MHFEPRGNRVVVEPQGLASAESATNGLVTRTSPETQDWLGKNVEFPSPCGTVIEGESTKLLVLRVEDILGVWCK